MGVALTKAREEVKNKIFNEIGRFLEGGSKSAKLRFGGSSFSYDL